jgi:hypothetical protein
MPKIFNKIFETNLTKGDLKTSSCHCVVSFMQSHLNSAFLYAQIVVFYSFCRKNIKLIRTLGENNVMFNPLGQEKEYQGKMFSRSPKSSMSCL